MRENRTHGLTRGRWGDYFKPEAYSTIGLIVITAPSSAGHHRRNENERIFQNTSGAARRSFYPKTGRSRCRTVPERLYRG
ncbi:hypothetical protein EKP94_26255 [Escherichia coli]|nr:hypothetical protein [Escherichia coli]